MGRQAPLVGKSTPFPNKWAEEGGDNFAKHEKVSSAQKHKNRPEGRFLCFARPIP